MRAKDENSSTIRPMSLTCRTIVSVQMRNVSPDQVAEIQQFLRSKGLTDAQITHPTTTLEDLFMRVIGENARTAGASPDVKVGAGNGQ